MVPMIGMMIMTVTAMIMKLRTNLMLRHWPLLAVGSVILALVLWLVVESVAAFKRHFKGYAREDH